MVVIRETSRFKCEELVYSGDWPTIIGRHILLLLIGCAQSQFLKLGMGHRIDKDMIGQILTGVN